MLLCFQGMSPTHARNGPDMQQNVFTALNSYDTAGGPYEDQDMVEITEYVITVPAGKLQKNLQELALLTSETG